MTGEVCMFDKFGYCKLENGCKKVHLKEICLLEDCEIRNRCQKRHPRPCKFTERGHCKFGDSCRFDHRPLKHLRNLSVRLYALEKENKMLLRVVEDQGRKIDKISRKDDSTNDLGNIVRVDSIRKQVDEFEGRLRQTEKSITAVNEKTCKVNDWLNEGLESLENRIQHLESFEDQGDNEEEFDEQLDRDKEIAGCRRNASNCYQKVIRCA